MRPEKRCRPSSVAPIFDGVAELLTWVMGENFVATWIPLTKSFIVPVSKVAATCDQTPVESNRAEATSVSPLRELKIWSDNAPLGSKPSWHADEAGLAN